MVWCSCRSVYLHILAILLFRDGRLQQATETEIQDRSRVVIQVGSGLTLSDINSATTCRRLGDDKTLVTIMFFFKQFFTNLRVETTFCSETHSVVNMVVQAGNTTCLPDQRPWFQTGNTDRLRHSFVCLTNTTSVVLRCRGPLVIRYLRIFTSQVCPKHWYDPPRCRKPCSDRCQNRPCDQWTGACLPACPDGFHGYDCERPCRCKDHREACDDVTGYCRSGCPPGYDPATFCTELCKNLTWGPGCSRRCNCIFNTPCNPVTGVCPHGCQAGFQWLHGKCQMKCEEGRYGRDCRETCGFCLVTCEGDTGDCVSGQCKAGYCGRRCDVKVTQSGCPKTCGKCFAQSCLASLEECTKGCQPGFYGVSCEAACPEVYKGRNCSQGCGRCSVTARLRRQMENNTICPSDQTGNCKKACPPNMWGKDCENNCSKPCPCGCDFTGDCLKNCTLIEDIASVTTQKQPGWIWALVILVSVVVGISAIICFIERRKRAIKRARTAQLIFSRMIQRPAFDSSPFESSFHLDADRYSPEQRARLTCCLALLVHKHETYEEFVKSSRLDLFRAFVASCTQEGQSPDDVTVDVHKETLQSDDDSVPVSIPDVAIATGTAVDDDLKPPVVMMTTEEPTVSILRKSAKSKPHAFSRNTHGLSVHFSPSVMSNEKQGENPARTLRRE